MTESEPGPGHEQADPDAASRAGFRSRAQSRADKGSRSDKGFRSGVESTGGLGANPSRRDIQQAYRKAHRHPWLRRSATVLAAGLAVLIVMGIMVVLKLNGNITQIDVSGLLGPRPAQHVDPVTNLEPMNILVMGVDTRALGSNEFGSMKDVPGTRADTTLVVHLSGDRKSAVVVSIPRDSMTHAPRYCADPNSLVPDGPIQPWNSNKGPVCLQRVFEGNTGIRINHFVVVNFNGFQSMVEALGAVTVCSPKAIDDPKSGLRLPAGISRVTGSQALAFVRERYSTGDGSDLQRIPRQQAFLASMVQEATSTKLLVQPLKLLSFLDAATKSLATDSGFGINTMREVAQSVVGMPASQIRFVTVPNGPYPKNTMKVQWTSDADALWKSIQDDLPLPGTTPAGAPKPAPKPTVTQGPALTVRPDKITVHVVNASGAPGLGKQTSADLAIQGFRISTPSTATTRTEGVIVAYSSQRAQSARTVAAAFPGATLVRDEGAGASVRVTLGAGSPYVVLVPNRIGTTPLPERATAEPTTTVTIKARTADANPCKA